MKTVTKPSPASRPVVEVNLAECIERNAAGEVHPKGSKISVKHVAYLYAYCKKHPREIVARYPRALTEAQVHLALAHYFLNREEFDARIEEDRRLNTGDSLSRIGQLPGVGVGGLLEAVRIEAAPVVKKST